MGDKRELRAVIVGAGAAGLATSRALASAGVEHVVLERGDRPGYIWSRHYDSLTLHTGKRMSKLAGLSFPRTVPEFPSRDDLLAYLKQYAAVFKLPVQTGVDVRAVVRDGARWKVRAADGREWMAQSVVMATGIASNPFVPPLPGRDRFGGRVRHSSEYLRPDDCRGRRVLVAGVGNSGGEIAAELAQSGVDVTVAVRSGAVVVPRDVAGVPLQYITPLFGWLPRGGQRVAAKFIGKVGGRFRDKSPLPPPNPGPCLRVPLVGFHLVDQIRAGRITVRPGLAGFTGTGVRFDGGSEEPFDDVILATGYRAAIGILGHQVGTDECGYGRRRSRVISTDQPNLYYVGHNPDIRGAIYAINRDAKRVVRAIAGT
ncbi:MAG TPA: NAD(P)/FAD-dependent oxidoreductase [Vicinamibacterales bacterium]|nr:NAD(P)/FAD-dependent oxidoreductase [Vicinamibacterales bacterium]